MTEAKEKKYIYIFSKTTLKEKAQNTIDSLEQLLSFTITAAGASAVGREEEECLKPCPLGHEFRL